MKEQILEMLRQSSGYLSGGTICKALGVSRAAVWKVIEGLRHQGYIIESAPNRGYRLVQTTTQLCAQEILPRLEDCPWRDTVTVLDTVDSTNSRAKALALQGAKAGTVLIADCQTGGRGRMGRSFLSPSGMGAYLSVVLRPQCAPQELMHLTCATAVAMCDAIENAAGFRPGIKWANDLVYEKRKLAGILTELSVEAESGQVQYAVVGIGINCCQTAEDFPEELRKTAGSVSMAAGRLIDRNLLAATMVQALVRMDRGLLTDRATMLEAYRRDCVTVGQQISLLCADSVRHGKAVGVTEDGALLVEFAPGQVEPVNSGEVSIRGMYGYL